MYVFGRFSVCLSTNLQNYTAPEVLKNNFVNVYRNIDLKI